ncbi:hypothetical protein NEOLI_004504 [Neolecta irregularis DAH-3]|uniref:Uncharacterized protein n=1 Tax=Neolecta irregularis (strain DAH-3) TaxID=1198029 RepID=A0A1U7LPK4_NEOID|nr:hypothetical protein NEOLI_004504 [Neolecta irregularis DAH-3]|eukprot:OLL24585.1 hypothetical protein NEOLI_004504 [Neolecta irregularis DAH-3]
MESVHGEDILVYADETGKRRFNQRSGLISHISPLSLAPGREWRERSLRHQTCAAMESPFEEQQAALISRIMGNVVREAERSSLDAESGAAGAILNEAALM